MRVREFKPERRSTPTKSPTGENWSEHKPDLQEDFNYLCGYCGSFDGFRHTYFEVDHFIPKSLFKVLGKISYCQYDNLVYTCKFCNNNKSSKWPSNDEALQHINDEGFIDPCDNDYDTHLYRTKDGGILWHTPLGKWMATKAFKFDERDYSIKLLWEVNQIRNLVLKLAVELAKLDQKSDEYKDIYQKAADLSFKYLLIDNELMIYYNSI